MIALYPKRPIHIRHEEVHSTLNMQNSDRANAYASNDNIDHRKWCYTRDIGQLQGESQGHLMCSVAYWRVQPADLGSD